MKTLEDFRRFYETDMLPALEPLEAKRKGICRNLTIAVGAVVLVALAIGGVALQQTRSPAPLMIVFVLGGLFVAGLWWMLTRGFVEEFKTTIIRRIVSFCDESLTYMPQSHISEGEFLGSTLFKHSIDRFRGEDLVRGRIGKTDVRFSELHAEYKTTTRDSKGHTQTHWHTIFKGLFFIADFNKNFSGRTVVLPDTAEKIFGRFGQTLQSMNLARSDLVRLEDPEFEREFVVYGTDQVEARYILSPALMQRILHFKHKLRMPVHIAFTASNVNVAISTHQDMFEPRIFGSLLDFDLVHDYLEQVQLATGIVEELNLNTRIWTKE